MTKFRHLTLEELLFHAEDATRYSPLIQELVHRLRHPEEWDEPDQKNDACETVKCPVCEANLEIWIFTDDSAPKLLKVE